ncbi:unnamed protein product [Linum trigynum]|uniref:Uncharacterized protein n=1 Tax=Linum trigynum TaxID=586398 RepID=A0AAV2FL59_9ROSI
MEENFDISEQSSFAAVTVLCDCDCDSASSWDDGDGNQSVEIGERLPPTALLSLRDSSPELYSELQVGAAAVGVVLRSADGGRRFVSEGGSWG